jgi:hypothetical protein
MMNCKGFVRKRLWINFKVLLRHLPGGTTKTTTNVSQVSRSPDRDLNPEPTKYEARVLTTQPRRLVVRNTQSESMHYQLH